MKRKGFTLIELLAVIVILAIIALIATPIIINIIDDTKEESNKRSVEMYASAVNNAVAKYQLKNNESISGTFTTTDGKILLKDGVPSLTVEYDGTKVVCTTIEIYKDGNIYLAGCNGNYTYGALQMPTSVSFAEDSWETIAANVKAGNLSKYNVGDTKTITLTGDVAGTYTVRIANTTTEECKDLASQSACGFVIEFVDLITDRRMNPSDTNVGGWPASEMYKFLNDTTDEKITSIYESLPEDLQKVIIDTIVVSGHGSSDSTNFTSTDKLYLLSTQEVWGKEGTSYETESEIGQLDYDTARAETRQLDYYKNIGVTTSNCSGTIKSPKGSLSTGEYWWLRSAKSNTTNKFFFVRFVGGWGDMEASTDITFWVSPAFRIG